MILERLEDRLLLAGDLYVTRLTPTGPTGQPFDILEVQFSRPVVDGTFLLDDVSMSGPGGPLVAKGVSKLAEDRYQVDVTGLTGLATYNLSIGPNIQGTDGRLMNQDHDATPGEAADTYKAALLSNGVTIASTNTTYDDQALVLYGKTATIDGTHVFSAVEVLGGAVVMHSQTTATTVYKLDWTVTDSLWIDGTSKIDVSGRGYLSGYTVGNTTVGGAVGNAGGTYGGLGFAVAGATTNAPYGDYLNPTYPGSGGGTFNNGNNPGGSGGGVIQVTATSAQIDGSIVANGVRDNTSGSGGSILLHAGTLSGVGNISAGGEWGGNYASSGGGGRVAVYYEDTSGFDMTKIAAPAGPNSNGPNGGSLGTVYLKKSGDATGQLRIDSHGVVPNLPTPLGLPGDTVFQVDNLIVSGTGAVAVPQHEMPIVAGTIVIENAGVLSHLATTTGNVYTLQVTTGQLTVDAQSKIDVSGKGYRSGYTVGNTTVGGAVDNAGGTYGGLGFAVAGATTNAPYGDYRSPIYPGSGGGTFNNGNNPGGSGGGVIQVTATSAQIDGSIVANGVENNTSGSGGSILFQVGTLSGTGSILAGSHWGGNYASSGGGGRVAVTYEDTSGFDMTKIAAPAGPNSNGPNGGSLGTVYLKKNGDATGQLRIDSHGVVPNLPTPLGLPGDTVFHVDNLVVSGAGAIAVPQHEMPIVAGTVVIEKAGVLSHLATTPDNVYTLQVTTDQLTIDAQSKIDVSGKGYLSGYTLGNTPVGGAGGNAGGSYGGAGFVADGLTNAVYGNPQNPLDPGSGGGKANANVGGSGGGVVKVTTRLAQIDGSILAHGGMGNGPGGSGGSLLLDARTLSGSGSIAADGVWGGNYSSNGGGGRVAVYSANLDGFDPSRITTLGVGNGSSRSADGTVVISQTPYFTCWSENALFHGTKTLSWAALGVDPSQVSADITAYKGSQAFDLATDQPATGSLGWDTTAVPDGLYAIRVTFHSTSSPGMGQAALNVMVNNSAVWHRGRMTTDQTWTPDRVHIVEGGFLVGAGAHLTIQPGCVVKFALGGRLVVESGGIAEAPATPAAPIVLTSLADDSVGGDTNMDGEQTKPRPGDWNGYTVAEGGTLTLSTSVEVRYMQMVHFGTLATSETWAATYVHRVSGDLLVPSGATLTIPPGAVVKFDPGAGITIQDLGSLNAAGTQSLPIVFTSVREDAVGGDTNGDGSATSPAAGDWRSLRLEGSAVGSLRYAEVRYGGNSTINSYGAGGMIESTGAILTIGNSRISESLKDGVLAGGLTNITNSLVAGTDRGVTAFGGGGTVTVVNCTVNDNRQGLLEHGGTLTVHNSLVTNNSQAGVIHDWGTERITVTYSDVWNPATNATNYSGTADKTGQTGNISTDPKYKNTAQGDYRLNYLSRAIDAADGTLAPTTDLNGAPRYDDPRTTNTGVAMPGSTAVPDLGAFEFVETAASNIDMVVASVVGPAAAAAGDKIDVNWVVCNSGVGVAAGTWHDAVYLSTDNTWSLDDVLLGDALHTGDLGSNQSCQASTHLTLPVLLPGAYYLLVRTNSDSAVFEGVNMANNTTASGATVAVALDVPELTLGAPLSGQYARPQQAQYYRLTPPSGRTVELTVDSSASAGALAVYVRGDAIPSRNEYDVRSPVASQPDQTLLLRPGPTTYYVMVYAESGAAAESAYSLIAELPGFRIRGITPASGGNVGPVTMTIEASDLTSITEATLIAEDGRRLAAAQTKFVDATRILATFDLTGAIPGRYDVRIVSQETIVDQSEAHPDVFETTLVQGDDMLPDAFQVVAGGGPRLATQLLLPAAVRYSRVFPFQLEVANEGNVDLVSPVLVISSPNGIPLAASSNVTTDSGRAEQILVVGSTGRAVLAPGERVVVPLYALATQEPSSQLVVQYVVNPEAAIDWNVLESDCRAAFPTADWVQTWANFKTLVGATRGSLDEAMRRTAETLGVSRGTQFVTGSELLMDLFMRAEHGQQTWEEPVPGLATAPASASLGETSLVPVCEAQGEGASQDNCAGYRGSSDILLSAAHSWVSTVLFPYLGGKYGPEVRALWERYVNGTSTGREIYNDPNHPFIASTKPKGFRESVVTRQMVRTLMVDARNEIFRRIKDGKITPANLPPNKEVTYDINDLLGGSDAFDSNSATGQSKNYAKDLNYSIPEEIPGNLAGGIGGSDIYGPDRRRIAGKIKVFRLVTNDQTIMIGMETDLNITVDDTVDLCPGDPGTWLEQFGTRPLMRLEANGRAHDVGITVDFKANPTYENIEGKLLPDAFNGKQSPTQPPGCGSGGSGEGEDLGGGSVCGAGDGDDVRTIRSNDPNDIAGPAGVGGEGHWLLPEALLPYTIRFENDPQKATAPAQEVVVTNAMNPNMDWTTFELGVIGFGSHVVNVPPGRQQYGIRTDTTNMDGSPLVVDIQASLDMNTRVVSWTFRSLDPASGQLPSDPFAGFLPPNDATHRGEGFLTYTVRAKAGLASGMEITNQASIVFDVNEPILTNTFLNTIDAGPPSSQVVALPALVGPTFTVTWQGTDDTGGSGIIAYDVFVSDTYGPWTKWQDYTALTSATFSGQVGHIYRFFSQATDNVGHQEASPVTYDAETTVVAQSNWQNPGNPYDVAGDGGPATPLDVLTLIAYINSHPGDMSLPAMPAMPPPYYNVNGDNAITALDVLMVITDINRGGSSAPEAEPTPWLSAALNPSLTTEPQPGLGSSVFDTSSVGLPSSDENPPSPRYPGERAHENPPSPRYPGERVPENPPSPRYPGERVPENPPSPRYPGERVGVRGALPFAEADEELAAATRYPAEQRHDRLHPLRWGTDWEDDALLDSFELASTLTDIANDIAVSVRAEIA